jgi:DNA-directed RNA polymerase specialized sigma24 family protein
MGALRGKSDDTVIRTIRNGSNEPLFELARRYFSTARRLLRSRGVKDSETPRVFSGVLSAFARDIRREKIAPQTDISSYLLNVLRQYAREDRASRKGRDSRNITEVLEEDRLVAARCISVLDERSKALLFARYAEHLNYEQIAARFQYSNPVIAQTEVEKAASLMERILSARLRNDN